MYTDKIDTLGAGRVNKAANIAAVIFFVVVMAMGFSGWLSTFPVSHTVFFIAGLLVCFVAGYIGGTKLEMDRLFSLTGSLIWVASAAITMCSPGTSVLTGCGLCLAFGTAAGGVSLYNHFAVGHWANVSRQVALEDLERVRSASALR
jgi:hypothetical protein